MKLASLKHGRDGRLVVVSADLSVCVDAAKVAPTLQMIGRPPNRSLKLLQQIWRLAPLLAFRSMKLRRLHLCRVPISGLMALPM